MADFATVAELETFMGVASGQLAGRGTAMLGYASAAIRRYTAQDLEVTAGRTESFNGDPWRDYLVLTQRPVTNVASVTVAGVAFTDFSWDRWGRVWKTPTVMATTAWDTGPVVVTYDSGYTAGSDEMASIKATCLEIAERALGGLPNTYGIDQEELRGPSPGIFLSQGEKMDLDAFSGVAVA